MYRDPRHAPAAPLAVLLRSVGTALMVGFLAVGVSGPDHNAVATPPAAEESDSKVIQGEWKCVETVEKGKSHKVPPGIIWVFAGDSLTVLLEGRKQHTGTFVLTPSITPAAIDMRLKGETAGNSDSDTIGIYKLERDKLTVCVGAKDAKDKRPTSFVYNNDFPTSSVILERVNRAEPEE